MDQPSGTPNVVSSPVPQRIKGHVLLTKSFHRPTYCHCCGDLLWGLSKQGVACIICNMVAHERCSKKSTLLPCSTLAHHTIKTPASHTFLEVSSSRRTSTTQLNKRRFFCSVCRRRIDAPKMLQCEFCETFIHCDCVKSALNNCRVFYSTFSADRETSRKVLPASAPHNWREGNLFPSSKCAACNKDCSSNNCFSGLRCELCQLRIHASCISHVVQDCDFGQLSKCVLHPMAVTLPPPVLKHFKEHLAPPRTSSSPVRTGQEDDSILSNEQRHDEDSPVSSPTRADFRHRSSEELEIFIYDGLDQGMFHRKQLFITPMTSVISALDTALRAFTILDDPAKYEFRLLKNDMVPGDTIDPTVNLYCQLPIGSSSMVQPTDNNEAFKTTDPSGIASNKGTTSSQPLTFTFPDSVHLLLKRRASEAGFVTFFADWIKGESGIRTILCSAKMTVADAIQVLLKKFDLPDESPSKYELRLVSLEANRDREEAIIPNSEVLWSYLENLHNASLSSAFLSRVYVGLAHQCDIPMSVFIGNLPTGRSQREYESAISRKLGAAEKWEKIETIYYENGAIVLTFPSATSAMAAVKLLRDSPLPSFSLTQSPAAPSSPRSEVPGTSIDEASASGTSSNAPEQESEKRIICMCLPRIKALPAVNKNVPVLVLVNGRSGGCLGGELLRNFRLLLSPCQVFSLEQGGPLPALHTFRALPDYRILCCGGDGTVGWVLSCLDIVSQESACQSPPVAVLPLGTGNDLSRVLKWGHSFNGDHDDLSNVLLDVMAAEAVNFDRWTISVIPNDSSAPGPSTRLPDNVISKKRQTPEDNSSVLLMNNYFGIGVDAKVALDFHNARRESPEKFQNPVRNKQEYFLAGLKRFFEEKTEIHKIIRIEIDGRQLELPRLDGIIILNISSWGSGSLPWGKEVQPSFSEPSFNDGLLEVVGIASVLHLGKMTMNLNKGIRLGQAKHIQIHLLQEAAVHVDGEPWVQPPCRFNIRRSFLTAVMLKRISKRSRRRHTEGGSVAGGSVSSDPQFCIVSQSAEDSSS